MPRKDQKGYNKYMREYLKNQRDLRRQLRENDKRLRQHLQKMPKLRKIEFQKRFPALHGLLDRRYDRWKPTEAKKPTKKKQQSDRRKR